MQTALTQTCARNDVLSDAALHVFKSSAQCISKLRLANVKPASIDQKPPVILIWIHIHVGMAGGFYDLSLVVAIQNQFVVQKQSDQIKPS